MSMKGKIKVGNLILRVEQLTSLIPHSTKYEEFPSYAGSFQNQVAPQLQEVQFTTSVRKDRENLLKELDGKTVVASADFMTTFECVVGTQKFAIQGGSDRAIYDITLVEDRSNVKK